MFKARITLSGLAGTGKSTVAKLLAQTLGYEFMSVGNYARTIALEKYQMTINEFQQLCAEHPQLDQQIDEQFKELCNQKTQIVVDYRLGFKFVAGAKHILLKVSDEIACQRIKAAQRQQEDVTPKGINSRNEDMRLRFLAKYGVDFSDDSNYHLVINTDELSPAEVVQKILNHFF
ncbi:MAG: AAA family ATPase [Fibrobacter sp.]|nr:AAA family ATPase [Fibrobacter sp.]